MIIVKRFFHTFLVLLHMSGTNSTKLGGENLMYGQKKWD